MVIDLTRSHPVVKMEIVQTASNYLSQLYRESVTMWLTVCAES